MNIVPIKRALLSVSNKKGVAKFAQNLVDLGVELISTGGTSQILHQNNVPHRPIEELTGMRELMGGRVKTLHPNIHGGILGRRVEHQEEMQKLGIAWIDLVVVNFYPFAEISQNEKKTLDEMIEYIDIGGPALIRAAAKNLAHVCAVIDPDDYANVIDELKCHNGISFTSRRKLALKAFAATSQYDAAIHHFFSGLQKDEDVPDELVLQLEKKGDLRYGENPHQKAYAYQIKQENTGLLLAKQHQGKPLSYNNLLDAEAAFAVINEFKKKTAVIIKHANPCGLACADTIEEAFEKAYQADSLAAFGGIAAINSVCNKKLAEAISRIYLEVLIAPDYTEEALAILTQKPNLRVLAITLTDNSLWQMKFITGGVLLQERDQQNITAEDLKIVTKRQPEAKEIEAMLFAWRALKHIKSNAILIAKQDTTIGIGAGQVSRIDAVDIAIRKAGDNIYRTILASDAFFPFRDSIDRIALTPIRAIIQPGGSRQDDFVIAACDEHDISMVFTGKRCFRH